MTLPAEVRGRFVEALAETGNVSRAAGIVGVNRHTAYTWRDTDRAFAASWERALDSARRGLAERVVETAEAMGLGVRVPVLDELTGDPVLDDDFEPVTRLDTSRVDARVLIKLIDRTMRSEDGAAVAAVQVNLPAPVELPARPRLVTPDAVEDAAFVEVGGDDG